LDILGYRIGNLGYITDAKFVPDKTIEVMKGVDTLVINALRLTPHGSHMSLSESLEVVKKIHPRVAYLTHISHQLGLHAEVSKTLPENVFLAYDDLEITIPD
jgi:phosphoribosyl 1,2-cyclic phosphate phosphodiesterase